MNCIFLNPACRHAAVRLASISCWPSRQRGVESAPTKIRNSVQRQSLDLSRLGLRVPIRLHGLQDGDSLVKTPQLAQQLTPRDLHLRVMFKQLKQP